MRYSRVALGMAFVGQLACGGQEPVVKSSSPETGPYGTIVTLEGSALYMPGGRIQFENGTIIRNEQMLHVSEGRLRFRAPTPARGAYELIGEDGAFSAGRFEPDPWRPVAREEVGSSTATLDFAVFGPESTAELRREDEALVALFYDQADVAAVTVPDVGTPSSGVAWAEAPQRMSAFVLEAAGDPPLLRALEIDLAGARQVSTELPEDANELLGFDREGGRRFAYVADTDEDEVLKYEWTADGLEQSSVTPDPAPPSSPRRKFAARNGHAWRVWVQSMESIVDVTFTVRAAYLAPGASAFAPALDLGGGDDTSSYFELLGMTDSGELALEFCAKNTDITLPTETYCKSIAFGPEGPVESSGAPQDTPRTLHLALPDGLYQLVCEDEVHALYAPGEPSGAGFGDPLLSACVDRTPPYRLALDGRPGFFVKGPGPGAFLTRQ